MVWDLGMNVVRTKMECIVFHKQGPVKLSPNVNAIVNVNRDISVMIDYSVNQDV